MPYPPSFSPITPPWRRAPTSISREISRNPSRWNDVRAARAGPCADCGGQGNFPRPSGVSSPDIHLARVTSPGLPRPERRGDRVTCAVKLRRTGTGERPVIAFPDETHVDLDFGPVTARVAKLSPHEPAIAA